MPVPLTEGSGHGMNPEERLVLLAWPRSGSSSLWRMLQAHPGLDLMPDEPFNESFADWAPGNPDYLARVQDIATLDDVLAVLFQRYRGIKVLSYQLDDDQLRHLVRRPDLWIVYISRRNLLQTAVSDRIAKQTRLWNRWDADPGKPFERYYDNLEPLDVEDLRAYVRDLADHLRWVDELLRGRADGRVFRLRYEDLYLSDPGTQRDLLESMWSFLEVTPLAADAVGRYLDPRVASLGGPATYRRLPNAAEIDAALGSAETGRLLPY